MDTIVYGAGTKTIVLRINWQIHSYTILYPKIHLTREKAIESLKSVQKCAFSPRVNKHSYLTKELEYGYDAKIFELLM